jgi:hypothetical protein
MKTGWSDASRVTARELGHSVSAKETRADISARPVRSKTQSQIERGLKKNTFSDFI